MAEFDIYFRDLAPEAQKAFLEAAGLSDTKEGNYDVFPIATVELENMSVAKQHKNRGDAR